MNPFDYSQVITDVRMPHMSGLELVQNVFRIGPDAKVMLMTASDLYQIKLQNIPKSGTKILSKSRSS